MLVTLVSKSIPCLQWAGIDVKAALPHEEVGLEVSLSCII